MLRREWLILAGSLFLAGCGSAPSHVKKDPPLSKAPALAQADDDIQLASGESEATPDTYRVKFETSKGDFVVEVHRDWAPLGAERFHELVSNGFYDDCKFFRVVSGFMVQFGISGDPKVSAKWDEAKLKDDPVRRSNKKGFMTYAKTGMPNSRTTQVFINFENNARLDADGFAPFAEVVEGMDVVESLYSGYGEAPSKLQFEIKEQGNKILETRFPKLDSIKKATIVKK